MNFVTASHTDVGLRKAINQDSMLLEKAETEYGSVLFAAVCDGMGGLEKGEAASASMVLGLANWFRTELPDLLYDGLKPEELRKSWKRIIAETDLKIAGYGRSGGFRLGTTCAALLAVDQAYHVMNVGDSRVYLVADRLYRLTKDQTFVQREIDLGRITPVQAAADPRRNVLLQCVGAGKAAVPDFYAGKLEKDQCFLLCSDGFTNTLKPHELYEALHPSVCVSAGKMRRNLIRLTETGKSRKEQDNISALLCRTW